MKDTINITMFDPEPNFIRCKCGRPYKNAFHKPYLKHIKKCPIYNYKDDFPGYEEVSKTYVI